MFAPTAPLGKAASSSCVNLPIVASIFAAETWPCCLSFGVWLPRVARRALKLLQWPMLLLSVLEVKCNHSYDGCCRLNDILRNEYVEQPPYERDRDDGDEEYLYASHVLKKAKRCSLSNVSNMLNGMQMKNTAIQKILRVIWSVRCW